MKFIELFKFIQFSYPESYIRNAKIRSRPYNVYFEKKLCDFAKKSQYRTEIVEVPFKKKVTRLQNCWGVKEFTHPTRRSSTDFLAIFILFIRNKTYEIWFAGRLPSKLGKFVMLVSFLFSVSSSGFWSSSWLPVLSAIGTYLPITWVKVGFIEFVFLGRLNKLVVLTCS